MLYRKVYVELIANVTDQPERRELLKIKAGNSNMTSQLGRAVEIGTVSDKFVACPSCRARNKIPISERLEVEVECIGCCNWDVDTNPSLLEVKPPVEFPWKTVLGGKMPLLKGFTRDERTMLPVKVSFAIFLECIAAVNDGFYDGSLTKKQANSLLYYVGIKEEAQEVIANRVWSMKKKNELMALGVEKRSEEENKLLEALLRQQANGSDVFEVWKGPPTWRRLVEMENTLEAPMHLLFLGIVRRINGDIKDWTSMCGLRASFANYADGILESLDKLGTSDWCDTMPHTKNSNKSEFVGWVRVSSNFVALWRLSPWFYSQLGVLAADPEYTEPVGRTYEQWTADHNREWLRVRELDCSGKASELFDRCQAERAKPDPAKVKDRLGGSVHLVTNVIVSMTRMISALMVDIATPGFEEEADRCIKIFLSDFEEWDCAMRQYSGRETKTWISAFNFMGLRNLPQQIKEFGPLVRYWEGKMQGEAILSKVKPLINSLRPGWAENAMKAFYKQRAIDEVCGAVLDEKPDDAFRKRHGRRVFRYERAFGPDLFETLLGSDCSFRLFKGLHDIQGYLARGQPLAGVRTTNGDIGMVNGEDLSFVPFVFANCPIGPTFLDLEYFQFNPIENNVGSISKNDFVVSDIILILPLMNETGRPDPNKRLHYTVLGRSNRVLRYKHSTFVMTTY